MPFDQVIIAGGGIGGLALALTLHEIGVPCTVYESVRELRPLGVGINLQPNAVRELADLGIGEDMLDAVGVPAREWALVGLNGKEIYAEPRGKLAGYHWHQYAVHRGKLHHMLYQAVLGRLGPGSVKLGHKLERYDIERDDRVSATFTLGDGGLLKAEGALLIGADGIHSNVRAQMHPDQPPIHWGGTIMWRGMARGRPIRSGSSFVGLGTSRHRVVFYPISAPGADGLADINWIAEKTFDTGHDWSQSGWFRPVDISEFAHDFDGFVYDWLDLPSLLKQSQIAFENPMIDRDPIATWVDGPVGLIGDAAHPMYPTGSNGASQAIVDARILGHIMLEHGATADSLKVFDDQLCGPIGQVALRNRSSGPFGLLELVEERCGGQFDDIEAVVPAAERAAFMESYQQAAGFAKDRLNTAPRTIPQGAQVARVMA